MAKKKQVLYPVVFMIVITAIFTTALALINELTIDRIKALEDTKQNKQFFMSLALKHLTTKLTLTKLLINTSRLKLRIMKPSTRQHKMVQSLDMHLK